MFPQVVHFPQNYPGEVTTLVYDPARDPFMPATYDDCILMGDIVYDFLAREANAMSSLCFPDSLGHSALSGDTHHTTDLLPSTLTSAGWTSLSTTGDLSSPLLPSPSSSQAPVSLEHHQTPPEQDCRNATPVFNRTRRKWCCSVCDKGFRGRWGCRRHIETTGKRAKCLACGANLKARDDLLLRHFTKSCKRNAGNPRLEDAFVEV